jgi:hypothetical protein
VRTREERLALVGARLEQVAAQRDLSPVLGPLAATEAAQLAELVRENPRDLEACYLLEKAQRSGDLPLISVITQMWQRIADAIPGDHPRRAAVLVELALALRLRFLDAGDAADLDAAIDAGQGAVAAAPATDNDRPAYLNILGTALQIRFAATQVAADLDHAGCATDTS